MHAGVLPGCDAHCHGSGLSGRALAVCSQLTMLVLLVASYAIYVLAFSPDISSHEVSLKVSDTKHAVQVALAFRGIPQSAVATALQVQDLVLLSK